MAKGTEAKNIAVKDIITGLGAHYQGMADKKIYCLYQEGGENIQIAISLTCPKTQVEFESQLDALTNDWSGPNVTPQTGAAPAPQPIPEITQEEKDNLQAMITKLNL